MGSSAGEAGGGRGGDGNALQPAADGGRPVIAGASGATGRAPIVDPGTATQAVVRKIDLRHLWDEKTDLPNPDKGWFHHQYDNGTGIYPVPVGIDLGAFPGLDHAFIRLSWSHFEPKEGVYDWSLIDRVVADWTAKKLRVALKITCTETYEAYATPQWVREAGASGTFFQGARGQSWEPEYGDPVFLAKLENFLKAMATRYGQQPWLAYVDLGSYGVWGEGHTTFSTKKVPSVEVVKKHIELHARLFPTSRLVVNDDWLTYGRSAAATADLLSYVRARGFALRDDSVLVNYYINAYPKSFSVSDPELFSASYLASPTIIELQHYNSIKNAGDWTVPDGASRGAEILLGAIRAMHASYVGYHGPMDTWLRENPKLTRGLINSMGYWFFPRSIELPSGARAGEAIQINAVWLNRGVAPAYQQYRVRFALESSSNQARTIVPAETADPRRYAPDKETTENYTLILPTTIKAGVYKVGLGMFTRTGEELPIRLALSQSPRDPEGYYWFSEIEVTN